MVHQTSSLARFVALCTLLTLILSALRLVPPAVQEESCTGFVELMDRDDGAGWDLLGALLRGMTPAALLLESRFLTAGGEQSAEGGGGSSSGSMSKKDEPGWKLFG